MAEEFSQSSTPLSISGITLKMKEFNSSLQSLMLSANTNKMLKNKLLNKSKSRSELRSLLNRRTNPSHGLSDQCQCLHQLTDMADSKTLVIEPCREDSQLIQRCLMTQSLKPTSPDKSPETELTAFWILMLMLSTNPSKMLHQVRDSSSTTTLKKRNGQNHLLSDPPTPT